MMLLLLVGVLVPRSFGADFIYRVYLLFVQARQQIFMHDKWLWLKFGECLAMK